MRYEYNDLLAPWNEGKVVGWDKNDLQVRSQECVVFIRNGSHDAKLAKDAYDAEIRRQEDAELEREKVETIRSVAGNVATIERRLSTVERVASRPEFKTWGFWFSSFAIVIATIALLRDYFGWGASVQAPQSGSQSAASSLSNSIQPPHSVLSNQAPESVPASPAATNFSGSNTSQPPRLLPK